MKKNLNAFCLLSFALLSGLALRSAHAASRGVGAGITYPASTQSVLVNPAALPDAAFVSAEGMYRFIPNSGSFPNNTFASVVGASGSIGLGADYSRTFDRNTLEAGLGFQLPALSIGLTGRSYNGDGLDFDTAVTLDLQGLRLSGVARGWKNSLDRLDIGVGYALANAILAVDFKKTYPFNDSNKLFYMDFSAAVDAGLVTLGFGYDVAHSQIAGWYGGGFHAAISYMIVPLLYLQGYYRPLAQELSVDKWAAGVRYTF